MRWHGASHTTGALQHRDDRSPTGITDPNPNNNNATDTTRRARLTSGSKCANPNPFVPGQSLTYKVVVK